MPVLDNARHERMAQGLAKGMPADAAYAAAGFKPHRGNAARLRANQSVRRRVQELQSRAAERAEISKAWVLDRLRAVVEAAMVENEEGAMVNAAAANRALELIGKDLGMFVDRRDIRVRRFGDMTREELQALLEDLGPDDVAEAEAADADRG